MALLKRIFYFIALLILSACQPVNTREPTIGEQNHSLPTMSLLATIQKQQALELTANDEGYAQQVLEMNYTKQPSTWLAGRNKNISLTMVPVRTYQDIDGRDCREYEVETNQKGGLTTSEIACRYGIKQWRVVISKQAKAEKEAQARAAKAKAEKEAQVEPASLDDTSDSATKKEVIHGVTSNWIIQMGSFFAKDDTAELIGQLKRSGYSPYVVQATAYGAIMYRVNIDVQGDYRKAKGIVAELKNELGLSPFFFPNH